MEPVSGHLEILDKGFGFLRNIDNNYQAGQTDTFVPAFMISKFGLREGTLIEGQGEPGNPGNQNLKLAGVEQVNGIPLNQYAQTETMHTMTSINPDQRLRMTQGPDDITGQALDLHGLDMGNDRVGIPMDQQPGDGQGGGQGGHRPHGARNEPGTGRPCLRPAPSPSRQLMPAVSSASTSDDTTG